MDFLPLFFQLKNKNCLLIGGGEVAYRKAELLHRAGGVLHVVAYHIDDALQQLVNASGGNSRVGDYQSTDLLDKSLVIAATDDRALNRRVSHDAQQRSIPVNVVDDPALCSVIFPAIIDRSPIVMAVSSGGRSPTLIRLLRAKIESTIPAAYGRLAALVTRFKKTVQQALTTIDQRRRFWDRCLQGPIAEHVLAGREQEAEAMLQTWLDNSLEDDLSHGEVYLVGAGPGDPDLLTFKALRLMQQADVVVYDRLVGDAIVDLTRRDAEKIYVGKERSRHSVPQSEINRLLVERAQRGQRVLRLKGGDPFIFARGGEEMQALTAHGVAFQIVPGITAALGCAAYAGIPLTHRDYAQSVRFLTAHLKNGRIELPWQELARGGQTLVFYMGLTNLAMICQQLIAHGLTATMPIALIQQGTTRQQRVIVSTLALMPEQAQRCAIKPPTLLIVGEVVHLGTGTK